MRRLETRPLDGFNETLIDTPQVFDLKLGDGREIDYQTLISNTPAVTSSYDAINDPQTVLGTPHLPVWDEATLFPVGRLDRIHGRNLNVLGKVTVEDNYGNEYHSLSIKGSDLSDPHFFESVTAERDYIIHGLQESLVLERVMRASNILRKNGIPTEYICGLALPESFPLDGDYTPLDIKTPKTLPQFLEHLASRFSQETDPQGEKSAIEIKAEMIERFKDCDYIISYRAMDSPYRFGELSDKSKFKAFADFVTSNYEGPELEEYFEVVNTLNYIYRDLAPSLGANVAKMHKLGITHNFLHANNITALGSIVDLDSCKGEDLGHGDDPQTEDDFFKDIEDCLGSLKSVIGRCDPGYDTRIENAMARQNYQTETAQNFVISYVKERYADTERVEGLLSLVLRAFENLGKKNAANKSHFGWLLSTTYSYLEKSRNKEGVIRPDLNIENYDERRQTFLGALPVKFLREIKPKILNPDWTMNDQAGRVSFAPDKPIHHPLRVTIKGLVAERFVKQCKDEGLFDTMPDKVINTLNEFYHSGNISSDSASDKTKAIEKYLYGEMEKLINHFCESDNNDVINPALNKLLNSKLKDFKEKIGQISLDRKHSKPNIDTLWLEDPSEYEQVFEVLGIDKKTKLELLNEENIAEIYDEADKDSPDMILIANYNLAEYISEIGNRKDIGLHTLGGNKVKTLALTGLNTQELRLVVLKSGNSEDDEYHLPAPNYTYAELLKDFCTKSLEPGPKLFDEEELDS